MTRYQGLRALETALNPDAEPGQLVNSIGTFCG